MTDLLTQAKNFCRNYTKVRGATVSGTIQPMPQNPNDHVMTFDNPPVWEGNDFYNIANPTRLTVPRKRGGRYFIHGELQWKTMPQVTFPFEQSQAGGFVGAYLMRNGSTPTTPREAQSIAPVVPGSTMITHNLLLETSLAKDDFIELFVFQRILGGGMPPAAFGIEVKANLTIRRIGRSA